MAVPGWMTDPAHDGDPVVRKVALPADSYLHADFSLLTPSAQEQARTEAEFLAAAKTPLERGQLIGIVAVLGGASLVALAVAVLAPGLPAGARVMLVVLALFLPGLALATRRWPRVFARYQTWIEGPLVRRPPS